MMIDYSRVVYKEASNEKRYSFVGIKKKAQELHFHLPLGYAAPEGSSEDRLKYNHARDLHIQFFKLFKQFRTIARANRELSKSFEAPHEDDTTGVDKRREWVCNHEEGEVVYYRYLDAFDSILEAFDELKILELERRLRLADQPASDLRNFHRGEAGRIYGEDGSFYDNQTLQPSRTIALHASDIAGMYCFLLRDLRQHVWSLEDPEPLKSEVIILAEKFGDAHLWPTASCWESTEWEATRATLVEKLETIDRTTALKDEDYFLLYEAIERFLFSPELKDSSEDGEIWGIKGFWPVWEWMVLTRLATEEKYLKRLLWIETSNLAPELVQRLRTSKGFVHPKKGRREDRRVLCRENHKERFEQFMRCAGKLGHPYPDAILEQARYELTRNDYWSKESCVYQEAFDAIAVKEGCLSEDFFIKHKVGKLYVTSISKIEGSVHSSEGSGQSSSRGAGRMGIEGDKVESMALCRLTPEVGWKDIFMRDRGHDEVFFGKEEELLVESRLSVEGGEREWESDAVRPELIGALARAGQWTLKPGQYWRVEPFRSSNIVRRHRHMSGALIVDAKYKLARSEPAVWSNDCRKQGAYEDALTLSCLERPAAYSIFICPGLGRNTACSRKAVELFNRGFFALLGEFEKEFESGWGELKPSKEGSAYRLTGEPFKIVIGDGRVAEVKVGFYEGSADVQKEHNRREIGSVLFEREIRFWKDEPENEKHEEEVVSIVDLKRLVAEELRKVSFSLSLLGVKPLTYSDCFFVKDWPLDQIVQLTESNDDLMNRICRALLSGND